MIKFLIGILLFTSPSSEKLDSQIQKYLNLKLKNYESFEFEVMNYPENISQLKIRESEKFVLSGPVGYIPVAAVRNDNSKYNSILSVRIKRYRQVLVAVNPIKNKTELVPSDFEYKSLDITSLRGEPITNISAISSLRTKSFIKIGTVLTKEKTEIFGEP